MHLGESQAEFLEVMPKVQRTSWNLPYWKSCLDGSLEAGQCYKGASFFTGL